MKLFSGDGRIVDKIFKGVIGGDGVRVGGSVGGGIDDGIKFGLDDGSGMGSSYGWFYYLNGRNFVVFFLNNNLNENMEFYLICLIFIDMLNLRLEEVLVDLLIAG